MAYLLNTGTRPLIFVANPRTGSTAMAKALEQMGATVDGGHHTPPRYIPDDAVVFQVVRSHFDVLNSLWWKGKPGRTPAKFIDIVAAGKYEHARVPYYRFSGVTHNVYYHNMLSLDEVFYEVGLLPPLLERTPTRTEKPAFETFGAYEVSKIRETYMDEMKSLNLPEWP